MEAIERFNQQYRFLDNLSVAHIHALAPGAPLNASGGVVWGFFGMPFNNNPNDGTVTPFATSVGGTSTGTWNAMEGNNTTLLAQLENLNASRLYINFHTPEFPGGEIRGAITPIPEPATLTLIGLGLVALGRHHLRRRATRWARHATTYHVLPLGPVSTQTRGDGFLVHGGAA